MPNCQNCAHFREERSLQNSLGLARSMGVNSALSELKRIEKDLRNGEVQQKSSLSLNDNPVWPARPKILGYCGCRENKGEYYIHEVKNRRNDCLDYIDKSLIPLHVCSSCQSFVKAQGYSQQHIDIQDILSQGTLTQGFDGPSDPNRIKSDLDRFFSSSQNNESAEITEAMYQGGKLSNTPQYYDWCRKYSTPREYALCRFENHDGKCHGWKSSW